MEQDSSNKEEDVYITGAENERRNMERLVDNQIKRLSELDKAIPRGFEEAADSRGIDSEVIHDIFDVYLKLQRHRKAELGFGDYDRDKDLLSDDDYISLKDVFREISGQDYKYGCATDLNNLQDLLKTKEAVENGAIIVQDKIDNTDWNSASLSEKKNDLFRLLNFKAYTTDSGETVQNAHGTFLIEKRKTSEELDSDASIARGKLAELYNNKVIDSGKFKYLIAALFEVVNEAKR